MCIVISKKKMDEKMKWCVVKFDKENKVDAIPAKWYIHDKKNVTGLLKKFVTKRASI